MARPLGPLAELGERVASTIDAIRESEAIGRASTRAKLASYVVIPAQRRASVALAFGFATLVAAVALLGGGSWFYSHRVLAFTVGTSEGQLQEWLAAPEGSAVKLRFSDGSDFRIQPKSRVRVVSTSSDGAKIAIERGQLHAEVVPRANGAWRVIAGPYSVQVTGTVFDVQWDPALERFEVSVTKGSVNVFGPLIEPIRPVAAGYRLVADLPRAHLEVGASDHFQGGHSEPVPSSSVATVLPIAEPLGSVRVGGVSIANGLSPTTVRNVVTSEKTESEWRALARAGKLKEAFVSAETQGFAGLCETASASDLLILGDAARLAGRPDRAVSALMSLRRRFPGDARQAAAAFALGKVAFDQRHAYAEAAKWFSTSLREQPNGSLSREASGRLIEALKNSGQSEEAERAARDYLAKYPEGPHAAIARALLQ